MPLRRKATSPSRSRPFLCEQLELVVDIQDFLRLRDWLARCRGNPIRRAIGNPSPTVRLRSQPARVARSGDGGDEAAMAARSTGGWLLRQGSRMVLGNFFTYLPDNMLLPRTRSMGGFARRKGRGAVPTRRLQDHVPPCFGRGAGFDPASAYGATDP
jgi:hypothetical protein